MRQICSKASLQDKKKTMMGRERKLITNCQESLETSFPTEEDEMVLDAYMQQ